MFRIVIAFPKSENVASLKSTYYISILKATLLIKWPESGSFDFNPENVIWFPTVPLIDNKVHNSDVIYTAAELKLSLLSMNSYYSITHWEHNSLQTMQPFLSPENEPNLNVEPTMLIFPLVSVRKESIIVCVPYPKKLHYCTSSFPSILWAIVPPPMNSQFYIDNDLPPFI